MTESKVEKPVNSWGGTVLEHTHSFYDHTIAIYEPPEHLQGGPLDYYLYDAQIKGYKSHLISGPQYREKISELYTDETEKHRGTIQTICNRKEITVGFKDDDSIHFITLLAKIGFSGPITTPQDIHERREESAFRMIPGSPVTVLLNRLCGHCQQNYQTRYETEAVVSEVESLLDT